MVTLRIASYHFKRYFFRIRTLFAFAFAFILIDYYLQNFKAVCVAQNAEFTILSLFLYLCDHYVCSGCLFWILIWMFSDAPFLRAQTFLQIRISRAAWIAGLTLFITAVCAIFWLCVALFSAIIMMPYADPSLEWGALSETLNRGIGSILIGGRFHFTRKLQLLYSALEAFFMEFGLHMLVSLFLIFVAININMLNTKLSGNIAAFAFVLFDFCFYGLGMPYAVYYFSPVSLCNLNMLDAYNTTVFPSVTYAFALLGSLNVLLIAGARIQARKIEIA